METTSMILRMAAGLAMILGILLVALYGLKRWTARFQAGDNQMIQVVASRMIMPKKHVCVIEVAGHHLVVGITENSMSLLSELYQMEDPEELKEGPRDVHQE